jgi:hypothetical protein
VRLYENATSVPGSGGGGQSDLIVTDVGWSPAGPQNGSARIGLAVTSHNNSLLRNSTISNVTATP